MPLAQLPLDCDSHVIADWFEFHILCSEYSLSQLRILQRSWDRRKNAEDSNPEGRQINDDSADEQFLESILQQFQQRIEVLGDAYPFEFNESEEELRLKEEVSDAGMLYLFCLFLSSYDKSEIFELDKFSYELSNRTRDLFQACATWAAAGLVGGCAVAFGFPRPDGSSFLTKLQECYSILGEGEVREKLLPGVSSNPKDEGIDVIAWTPRNDGAAGKQYILGQAASGANWPGKSVREYFRPFHEHWFSEVPPSDPVPALFIPFCIPITGTATLQQQLAILTRRYGAVYYRYMIPGLAGAGLQLANANAQLTIERVNDLPEIKEWVAHLISRLKLVATA